MILKRISILNYKNLEEVELGFSAKLNCFFGLNGMGKTNLLDAVYFLSFCKSSGNPIDSQNIRHEQDFFVIQGFYEAEDGTPEEIYCGMKRRSKKDVYKRQTENFNCKYVLSRLHVIVDKKFCRILGVFAISYFLSVDTPAILCLYLLQWAGGFLLHQFKFPLRHQMCIRDSSSTSMALRRALSPLDFKVPSLSLIHI